jgi:hypothetical protein
VWGAGSDASIEDRSWSPRELRNIQGERRREEVLRPQAVPRQAGMESAMLPGDTRQGGMPMSRDDHAIALDDDPLVPLAVRIPASQYRVLRDYCRYRGHDERKVPMAAAGAIAAFFERDRAFQTWRQEHPDPAPAPVAAGAPGAPTRRPRRRRVAPPAA